MSNTPNLARKNTRTAQQKKQAELSEGLRIKYAGQTYEITTGDLSALDELALRRECGMSFGGLMEAFTEAPGIDLIAIVIWLARRTSGEKMLKFATVAEAMIYDEVADNIEIDDLDPAESPGESEPAEG